MTSVVGSHDRPVTSAGDAIASGVAALARGDWAAAREAFQSSLDQAETAEALEGLSDALFWLEEIGPSLEHRARAYSLHREHGDRRRAARAALWLAIGNASALGNGAVANGWLQRAETLLEESGPCAEQGWFHQLRGKMSPDAATTARHARQAVEIARRHGDTDLEVWALSEQGRALVSMGQVDEGMAMLDEAVAAATAGEARSFFVVGNACCNMLSACDRAADFVRAVQWCRVVDEFTRRCHFPPIFHFCRVVYGGVLIATGRWDEAERELKSAVQAVERRYPFEKAHSLSRLALLCVRRGRLEEAGQLLAGLETQDAACEAAASLYLARGETDLAVALLRRRLDSTGDGLPAVPLLQLLVEASLRTGDVEAAGAARERLQQIAARSGRPPLQASARLAEARVDTAATGTPSHVAFEQACALFERSGMPFEAAVSRLEWARALAGTQRPLASEDARLALTTFEALGAQPHADQAAALVRELGGGSRPGPRVPGELTRREGEVLGLLGHGLSNREIGQRLFISPKTVEHHVGRVLSKLALRSRTEAVAWVLRHSSPANSGTK